MRYVTTRRPGRGSGLVLAALMLAGCASVGGGGQSTEKLDERTGVTLTRQSAPLEFYASEPQAGLDESSFAWFGALEVNRMGVRHLFVWVSVLPGRAQSAAPQPEPVKGPLRLHVLAGDVDLAPEYVASQPSDVGLSGTPYKRPADWARDGYFEVNAEQLRTIRDAPTLALGLEEQPGTVRRYELWKSDRAVFAEFVDKLAQ
jgi:hypothetical protein